jgi:hypothetical protein
MLIFSLKQLVRTSSKVKNTLVYPSNKKNRISKKQPKYNLRNQLLTNFSPIAVELYEIMIVKTMSNINKLFIILKFAEDSSS